MAKSSQPNPRQGRHAARRGPATAAPTLRTPATLSAPGPASLSIRISTDAVLLFQTGMESMQRHDYSTAADRFRALLAAHPGERALLDRTRVYLDLCDRESRKGPQAPATPEEKLTAATAALNDGREDDAERLARSVLDEVPEHDLALYLLAAVHARRGNADAALGCLSRAVGVSPDVRAQARHDSDFACLRDLESFRQLLDSPLSAQSGSRRQRRAPSDR